MKLTLLNQLSKVIPPTVNLDLTQQPSTKPKSLLLNLQDNADRIELDEDAVFNHKKQRYAFLGIDRNSSKHLAMEEEMESIEKGDPVLYRKILSLD